MKLTGGGSFDNKGNTLTDRTMFEHATLTKMR